MINKMPAKVEFQFDNDVFFSYHACVFQVWAAIYAEVSTFLEVVHL